jgi:putative MATE family efflux protein
MTRGFGILFAQCFGREDHAMLRAYISAAKRLCIGISLVLSVVCILALRSMFMFMQTPADIIDDAYIYFVIILIGIEITVLNNLAITILQSLGDSKTPLSAMIISSLANIVMDIFLVMGLGIGVAGAAIATVLAQLFSFIYCFYKIKMIDIFDKKNYSDVEVNGKNITFELVKIGIPVAFMNSITAAGGIILQYFVNLMGSGYVAAYSACMKFASLFEQFGMSAGLSMMTFVGQNMGAGKYDRIRKGVRQGLLLATILNIPLALVQILFPEQLARIFLSDPEIISYCKDFLPILGISLFALGWLFVYRYSVQGLGNTFVPMLSGALEVIMRLTVCFTVGRASFRGIALSEVSAWIGAFIMLMITYYVVMGLKSKA